MVASKWKGLLTLLLIPTLFGCGGSDDNQDNNSTIVVTQSGVPANTVAYIDSRVKLYYPVTWTLLYPTETTVQFSKPETNEFGGNDNCTLSSGFTPESSLIEIVDDFIELTIANNPDPEISFLTVNGKPAARVTGNVQLFNVTAPTKSQIFYQDNTGFLLFCFGDTIDQESRVIMDSMSVR